MYAYLWVFRSLDQEPLRFSFFLLANSSRLSLYVDADSHRGFFYLDFHLYLLNLIADFHGYHYCLLLLLNLCYPDFVHSSYSSSISSLTSLSFSVLKCDLVSFIRRNTLGTAKEILKKAENTIVTISKPKQRLWSNQYIDRIVLNRQTDWYFWIVNRW